MGENLARRGFTAGEVSPDPRLQADPGAPGINRKPDAGTSGSSADPAPAGMIPVRPTGHSPAVRRPGPGGDGPVNRVLDTAEKSTDHADKPPVKRENQENRTTGPREKGQGYGKGYGRGCGQETVPDHTGRAPKTGPLPGETGRCRRHDRGGGHGPRPATGPSAGTPCERSSPPSSWTRRNSRKRRPARGKPLGIERQPARSAGAASGPQASRRPAGPRANRTSEGRSNGSNGPSKGSSGSGAA
jgi:hypothetical protein